MNFAHAELCFASSSKALELDLLLELAKAENDPNLLFQMTLETFMKSEEDLHQLTLT
jgi:hypothetical protein